MLGGEAPVASVHPDREPQVIDATQGVPVGVGHQHTEELAAVVVARVELPTDRPGRVVRGTFDQRQCRDMGADIGAEPGIDQQVALWVLNQDCRGGELALVTKGPAFHRERRAGLVGAGRELIHGHAGRRARLGKGFRPGGGQREGNHG